MPALNKIMLEKRIDKQARSQQTIILLSLLKEGFSNELKSFIQVISYVGFYIKVI